MKASLSTVAVCVVSCIPSLAFQAQTPLIQRLSDSALYGYVPSGMTAKQWAELKKKDAAKKKGAQNGRLGPKGFKSRSFQSFQEALERGEANHLMPVTNAKERLRKGELKKEDIPYMQRGGSWDNTDVKGAKKKKWLKSDKEYASGGFKKELSVSVFGYGEGMDWTGKKAKTGPGEMKMKVPKMAKNYKAPNVNDSDNKPGWKFW